WFLTSLVSVESCTNTIARPSGDQSGVRWLKSPLVSCFGSPPPDGTTYRWLPRRHEPALVLHEWQGGVHPAVEPLGVRPAGDRARRNPAPPRILFYAVGL